MWKYDQVLTFYSISLHNMYVEFYLLFANGLYFVDLHFVMSNTHSNHHFMSLFQWVYLTYGTLFLTVMYFRSRSKKKAALQTAAALPASK